MQAAGMHAGPPQQGFGITVAPNPSAHSWRNSSTRPCYSTPNRPKRTSSASSFRLMFHSCTRPHDPGSPHVAGPMAPSQRPAFSPHCTGYLTYTVHTTQTVKRSMDEACARVWQEQVVGLSREKAPGRAPAAGLAPPQQPRGRPAAPATWRRRLKATELRRTHRPELPQHLQAVNLPCRRPFAGRGGAGHSTCRAAARKMPRVPPATTTSNCGRPPGSAAPRRSRTNSGADPASSPT